jgi:hypothetical protein
VLEITSYAIMYILYTQGDTSATNLRLSMRSPVPQCGWIARPAKRIVAP